MALTQHSHSTAVSSGVTELILSAGQPEQLSMVLPMLAHLSRQDDERWITWIAPRSISRELLEQFGVDAQKLRLIHPPQTSDHCWILWEALSTGTSHTVVASPGVICDRDMKRLEHAAYMGNSRGLLLRFR